MNHHDKYPALILLTICLFHFSCFSKEKNDSIKLKPKKFSFAISAGGVYPFRHGLPDTRVLYISNTPSEDMQVVKYSSSNNKGVITKNIGIYFEFQLVKNLFLNVGLNYSQVFYETKSNTTFDLTFYGNASINSYRYKTTSLLLQERYYFASVPISYNYRLNGRKNYYMFGIGACVGVARNVIIETPGIQYGATQTIYGEEDPIKPMGTLLAKAGVFHPFCKTLSVGFEPEFRYYFSSYHGLYTLGGNLVLKF